MGGGIGMGNTCKPMAVSFQCMTKSTTNKKKKEKKKSYDQPRQHIKKQRHYFANKGLPSQGYGFSSSHVWMGELENKES